MQGNNIVTLTTSLVMMFCNITLLLLVTIIEMPLKALMYLIFQVLNLIQNHVLLALWLVGQIGWVIHLIDAYLEKRIIADPFDSLKLFKGIRWLLSIPNSILAFTLNFVDELLVFGVVFIKSIVSYLNNFIELTFRMLFTLCQDRSVRDLGNFPLIKDQRAVYIFLRDNMLAINEKSNSKSKLFNKDTLFHKYYHVNMFGVLSFVTLVSVVKVSIQWLWRQVVAGIRNCCDFIVDICAIVIKFTRRQLMQFVNLAFALIGMRYFETHTDELSCDHFSKAWWQQGVFHLYTIPCAPLILAERLLYAIESLWVSRGTNLTRCVRLVLSLLDVLALPVQFLEAILYPLHTNNRQALSGVEIMIKNIVPPKAADYEIIEPSKPKALKVTPSYQPSYQPSAEMLDID